MFLLFEGFQAKMFWFYSFVFYDMLLPVNVDKTTPDVNNWGCFSKA